MKYLINSEQIIALKDLSAIYQLESENRTIRKTFTIPGLEDPISNIKTEYQSNSKPTKQKGATP